MSHFSIMADHPRSIKRQQQRHRVEAQRNSILVFSSDEDDELNKASEVMNEPFPPELDFAQITKHYQFQPNNPPPPPPRDPKRRSYLSGSPSLCHQQHRPVSYSFEKPDVVQRAQRPRSTRYDFT